jgi:hypothetical protein
LPRMKSHLCKSGSEPEYLSLTFAGLDAKRV